MSTPADRYHTYARGWTDGAGHKGIRPEFQSHPTLGEWYMDGYVRGQTAFRAMCHDATELTGYEPSILRTQTIKP